MTERDAATWTACAVCGSRDAPRVMRGVIDYVTGEPFTVTRCRACDFGLTSPRPTDLSPYYPTRYRRFNRLGAAALRWAYRNRVAGWMDRLPAKGRALEIGSGTGWMLRALRERGWDATGTERNAETARLAADASRATVLVGGLEATEATPSFDLLVMFHVLEHLDDPIAVLRDAARRLRPGGVLVLGLPNGGSWQARMTGRRWMHLDPPRHLAHFSRRSIEQACAMTGFRVTRIDHRSYEHDALGWMQSWLDALGFESGFVLKRLFGMRERRGGTAASLAAYALSLPMVVVAFVLAFLSWPAKAGAVMEVWAVREPRDGSASDRR
jgi:SAM-dependent methyltransferase